MIAAALAALCACEDRPVDPAAAERGNTIAAAPARPQDKAEVSFCDAADPVGAGPAVKLPALAGGPAPAKATGWRWINLWATWCKPCTEEMPRLRAFRDRLKSAGHDLDLLFVSVEAGDPGPRLADPEALAGWLQELGAAGGSIPIHILVDPQGKRRCVRAGPVEDRHLPQIEQLLGGA